MNRHLAEKLLDMTTQFYRNCADDFSKTRQSGWRGWNVCADALGVRNQSDDRDAGRDEDRSDDRDEDRDEGRGKNRDESRDELRGKNQDKKQSEGRNKRPLEILDIACGNLRFEKWLNCEFPDLDFRVCAVDACNELVKCGALDGLDKRVSFTLFDMGKWLIDIESVTKSDVMFPFMTEKRTGGEDLKFGEAAFELTSETFEGTARLSNVNTFDIAICFGFAHHVPGVQARVNLIIAMLNAVNHMGYVVISFWCFTRSEKMRKKAEKTTKAAIEYMRTEHNENIELDENDYLLGFSDFKGVFRYCHSFTGEEIDYLLSAAKQNVAFTQIARFSADGKSGNLNEYVVLQKI